MRLQVYCTYDPSETYATVTTNDAGVIVAADEKSRHAVLAEAITLGITPQQVAGRSKGYGFQKADDDGNPVEDDPLPTVAVPVVEPVGKAQALARARGNLDRLRKARDRRRRMAKTAYEVRADQGNEDVGVVYGATHEVPLGVLGLLHGYGPLARQVVGKLGGRRVPT